MIDRGRTKQAEATKNPVKGHFCVPRHHLYELKDYEGSTTVTGASQVYSRPVAVRTVRE